MSLKEKEEVLEKIKKVYLDESEVCMFDLLADLEVPKEFSYEDAFDIYIMAMKWAEGDRFYTVQGEDEEPLELPL